MGLRIFVQQGDQIDGFTARGFFPDSPGLPVVLIEHHHHAPGLDGLLDGIQPGSQVIERKPRERPGEGEFRLRGQQIQHQRARGRFTQRRQLLAQRGGDGAGPAQTEAGQPGGKFLAIQRRYFRRHGRGSVRSVLAFKGIFHAAGRPRGRAEGHTAGHFSLSQPPDHHCIVRPRRALVVSGPFLTGSGFPDAVAAINFGPVGHSGSNLHVSHLGFRARHTCRP